MISITSALAESQPPTQGPAPHPDAYAVLQKNASQSRDFDISTQKYFSFPHALDRRISANESVDFGMPNENYTEYAEIPHYIKATSMAFCIAIMCLGVIGNVMVPIVILKTKDMRNSTNIFLVNLSIADLMVLLVCTPTVLVEVNSKPETWVLGKELCLAVPFVELTVAHASVLTILAISFERYYAICEPLRAGYVCTKTRATLICALAWFFAALFTSPVLAIAEHRFVERDDGRRDAQCLTQASTFWPILFYVMIIIFLFLLPLVVLVILYSIIAKNLITAASKVVMNKTVDPSNSRARKQVILMLGTVVLCFFVCLIPFRVLVLWIIVAPTEHLQEMSPEKYYNLLYFSRIMLYINSAINPILYNLMSSKFRIGFCKVCVCYKNTGERVPKGRARRKRAGTVTTGSTTSSSLTRTTDSLKKLFRNKGLDRCNTTKSDTETDSRNNVENANEDKIVDVPQNNFLSRLFGNKKFVRQQSAPLCTGNAENHKRNRMMSEGDILEPPASSALRQGHGDFERIKVGDSTRKSLKLSDFNDSDGNEIDRGQGSLRRSVLINSAKARNVDENKCNDDEQKTRVCMVAFKKSRSTNCDLPESFV